MAPVPVDSGDKIFAISKLSIPQKQELGYMLGIGWSNINDTQLKQALQTAEKALQTIYTSQKVPVPEEAEFIDENGNVNLSDIDKLTKGTIYNNTKTAALLSTAELVFTPSFMKDYYLGGKHHNSDGLDNLKRALLEAQTPILPYKRFSDQDWTRLFAAAKDAGVDASTYQRLYKSHANPDNLYIDLVFAISEKNAKEKEWKKLYDQALDLNISLKGYILGEEYHRTLGADPAPLKKLIADVKSYKNGVMYESDRLHITPAEAEERAKDPVAQNRIAELLSAPNKDGSLRLITQWLNYLKMWKENGTKPQQTNANNIISQIRNKDVADYLNNKELGNSEEYKSYQKLLSDLKSKDAPTVYQSLLKTLNSNKNDPLSQNILAHALADKYAETQDPKLADVLADVIEMFNRTDKSPVYDLTLNYLGNKTNNGAGLVNKLLTRTRANDQAPRLDANQICAQSDNVGNCWMVASILALAQSATMQNLVRNNLHQIKPDQGGKGGVYTVTFPGDTLNKVYTITSEEVSQAEATQSISTNGAPKRDPNTGKILNINTQDAPNARQILELALKKYTLDHPEIQLLGGGNPIDALSLITGKPVKYYRDPDATNVEDMLKTICGGKNTGAIKGFTATIGADVYTREDDKAKQGRIKASPNPQHAFVLTAVDWTKKEVQYKNPWDTSATYTMTFEEFKNLFAGENYAEVTFVPQEVP